MRAGTAADTPAPIVQVVADLDDGTRPAGVVGWAWCATEWPAPNRLVGLNRLGWR